LLKLTLFFQILSITCDNASNNDKMVEHLATVIEHFPGTANQTRCFAHILNLVAKSVLRQFDVTKKMAGNGERMDFDNDAAAALAGLAQELEDSVPALADDVAEELPDEIVDDEISDDDDNDDGLGDERNGMSEAEVADLDASLVPIRLMLTKVSP
jgi:hypothetical protein